MSNVRKNKWIKLTTALSTLMASSQAKAIDLQSKTKNVDRTDFNTISSPFKKITGQYSIIGEVSDTKQPLILKQNNGQNQTLIEGLQAFELSFLHELTDNIQLGILVPGEKPYGLIGPYNEAKTYLGNILIEPKVYISDNVALIPVYYVPTSNQANLTISGKNETLDLGYPKGAYGLKASAGMNHDNGITTAYQIGAIIAPESKFRDIDQTMKLQFGAGIKKELSGGLKLLAEAYGEKYKSNMPLEALASIEYSNKNFMVRIGGGTGDLQNTGSNTTRMLANFAYYFGQEKKSPSEVESVSLSNKPINEDEYKKFKNKVEKTEEQLEQEELKEQAPTQEQNSPIINDQGKIDHTIPVVAVRIQKSKNPVKLPFEQAREAFLATIDKVKDEDDLSFLKHISDDDFKRFFNQRLNGQDFSHIVDRSIASTGEENFIEKIEKVTITKTAIFEIKKRDFHWTEEKAKYVLLNLKRANLSLKENLDSYAQAVAKKTSTEKSINEINWGVRVFKRNLDSWNLLTASYMEETGKSIDRMSLNASVLHSNYFDQALDILNKNNHPSIIVQNKTEGLKAAQDFVVNVATKLNVRKSPKILLNNLVGQLKRGDVVRTKTGENKNSFVEIEIVSSKNLQTETSPLFVNLNYLKPIETPLKLTETKAPEITPTADEGLKSILDDYSEVSKLNHQDSSNLDAIKAVLDFNKEQESLRSTASEDDTNKAQQVKVEKEAEMKDVSTKIDAILDKSKDQVVNKSEEVKTSNPAETVKEQVPVTVVEPSNPVPEKAQEVKAIPINSEAEVVPQKAEKVVSKKETKKVVVKTKEVVKKALPAKKVKVETITESSQESKPVIEPKVEATPKKVEIIYDEPAPVVEVKAKHKNSHAVKPLPPKKVIVNEEAKPMEVTPLVEESAPAKKIEVIEKTDITNTPAPIVEAPKAQEPVIEKTPVVEVKAESKATVIESKPEIKAEEKPVVEVKSEPKVEAPMVVEKTAEQKKAEEAAKVRAEMKKQELNAIDRIIELKQQKAVEVKSKAAPVVTPSVDENVVEVESGDAMDRAISKKIREYKQQQEMKIINKPVDPKDLEPLQLKEEAPTNYQTGPKFD